MSRSPAAVLGRVEAGERFVVCRHKRAVATLQPLSGAVYGFDARPRDIFGGPIGTVEDEVAKLSDLERFLLTDAVKLWKIFAGRGMDRFDLHAALRKLEEMALKGLVRKTSRGWELAGRGMMLREAMVDRETLL